MKPKRSIKKNAKSQRLDTASLVQSFLERNARLADHEVYYLDTFALSHLELIAKGDGTKEDWQAVADAINIAEALSVILGLKDQSGSALDSARLALTSLKDRKKSGLSLVAKASELEAIRLGLDIASQVHGMCTRAQLRKAHDAVISEIQKRQNKKRKDSNEKQ
jgi:hypothetical protein